MWSLDSLTPVTQLGIALTLAALAVHLWAEAREQAKLAVAGKLLASTGFLLAALGAGALERDWGRWLFLGLGLSWIGDACLLSQRRGPFLAGLVAFLLGHLAYAVACLVHGVALTVSWVALAGLALVAIIIDRWLSGRVEDEMRLPVRAYTVVISLMLALALGAWQAGAPALLAVGAALFYVSDLSVARDRFVSRELVNRLWGLPAYYFGQLCLALAASG